MRPGGLLVRHLPVEALDVIAPAKLGRGRLQGRRSSGQGVTERFLQVAILRQAQHKNTDRAVVGVMMA